MRPSAQSRLQRFCSFIGVHKTRDVEISRLSAGQPQSRATRQFFVELIKPSHYDDDGYVIQWLVVESFQFARLSLRFDQ